MPIFSPPIPYTLQELSTSMINIGYNQPIYFYKDHEGVIKSSTIENISNSNNFGYSFQFLNGDVIYTSIPITNYLSIPWNFPYTTLNNLWTSHLILWLDAMDTRTISTQQQKWLSKSYSDSLQCIENTTNYSFTHTNNNTIDLTTGSNIESSSNLDVKQFFKIGFVFSVPTQNINNKTIFQHNRFSIRITQQTAPSGDNKYMIGIFDNGSYKRGITFANDANFKYFLYTDESGLLFISGNTANQSASPNYYQATSQKIYIGQDNSGSNNSLIKVHEVLYYQSTTQNINYVDINTLYSYMTTRWNLTSYTDLYNILPFIDGWEYITSHTHTNWSDNNYVYKPTVSQITMWGGGLTNITQNNRKIAYGNGTGYRSLELPIPFFINTAINVNNAFINASKIYTEFIVYCDAQAANSGVGFVSINRTRWDNLQNSHTAYSGYWFMCRMLTSAWPDTFAVFYKNAGNDMIGVGGSRNGSGYRPDFTQNPVVGVGLDCSTGTTIKIKLYFNGLLFHTEDLTGSQINSTSNDVLTPCIYHYGSGSNWSYEYKTAPQYLPSGYTYIV